VKQSLHDKEYNPLRTTATNGRLKIDVQEDQKLDQTFHHNESYRKTLKLVNDPHNIVAAVCEQNVQENLIQNIISTQQQQLLYSVARITNLSQGNESFYTPVDHSLSNNINDNNNGPDDQFLAQDQVMNRYRLLSAMISPQDIIRNSSIAPPFLSFPEQAVEFQVHFPSVRKGG
jgi:hypothetical protein